jgi:hypothetical protein
MSILTHTIEFHCHDQQLAMKLLITFLAAVTLVQCAPNAQDLEKFELLKNANTTFASVRQNLARSHFIKSLLARTVKPQQFSAVNEDYRTVLASVINFNGTTSLTNIESWINYYRTASLTMKDVKVEVRRAIDYLTPFMNKAASINQQRSNALALPFDQKVPAVAKTLDEFILTFPVLDQISEQLDAALYDFNVFLKEV